MKRELDGTGYQLYAIGLGAMPLSIAGRPEKKDAMEVIRAFVENGGNFIDTANVYCLDDGELGHNERLIYSALTQLGARNEVLVATKGGLRRPRGEWVVDAHPEWLRTSCEQSLRDLHCEIIDLYYLHAPDPNIPFEESLGMLIRLKEEGKIRHLGLSNIDSRQLELALKQVPIAAVQNRCHPFHKQDFQSGLADLCQNQGISYVPYSPVGGRRHHERLTAHPLFQDLGEKHQASPYQIALAWLLQKGEHILPIPGASKIASVLSSMGAIKVQLETGDREAIDQLADD
ncbi:aldo/keto reductase [Nitrosococcus halophilus Nc 4]|uniref:Aldo/keto reductase n=1 Tax=Nitrosococcus halophilus (strain Nc4) TaxID=472759 RepID=D5C576_NITHN|nr:aldo/keto reductase [Nitrosococcus halophilus]ADE15299.1 aldo/keto reductase [Nitrosococcus halophilus Nc 4]